MQDVEVIFVGEHDSLSIRSASKVLGKLGLGTAAAIPNAVFHATGKRVRVRSPYDAGQIVIMKSTEAKYAAFDSAADSTCVSVQSPDD